MGGDMVNFPFHPIPPLSGISPHFPVFPHFLYLLPFSGMRGDGRGLRTTDKNRNFALTSCLHGYRFKYMLK
jgi:hypothetical protein